MKTTTKSYSALAFAELSYLDRVTVRSNDFPSFFTLSYLLLAHFKEPLRFVTQPLWKVVWRFLKELEAELPFDAAIPLLSIYTKENKSFYQKDTCTKMLIAAQFTIRKMWNQAKCPSIHESLLIFCLKNSQEKCKR